MRYGVTIVMLLPADTGARWYHNYIYNGNLGSFENNEDAGMDCRFLEGRPSMICVFRGELKRINVYCCDEFAKEVDISIARYDNGTCYLKDKKNGKPSAKLKYCPWCNSEVKINQENDTGNLDMIWAYDENASSAMVTLEVCFISTSYMSSCKQAILTNLKKYVLI